MPALRENAITLLSSTTVDMKTAGSTTLFSTPSGLVLYVTHVVVRDPTASLAGGTDYDFTNWRQTVDLSSMTTANTDYIVLSGSGTKYTENTGNFQITVSTGSTAVASAKIDVFGYLA